MIAPEFEQIVSRIIDQEYSPEDVAELNRVLPIDREARLYFIRMVRVHQELRNLLGADAQRELAVQFLEKEEAGNIEEFPGSAGTKVTSIATAKARRQSWVSWAASVALLVGVGALYWNTHEPQVEFRVSQVEKADGSMYVGQLMKLGSSVNFESGMVKLESNTGTEMWVQGPANLKVDGNNQVTLQSGSVWCEMDQTHLVIQTPFAKLKDIGTKFGVTAGARTLDVDVLQGMVQATDVANRKHQEMIAMGEHLSIVNGVWSKNGKPNFARYANSPLCAVGVVKVMDDESASLVKNQFAKDTHWTPVKDNYGVAQMEHAGFRVSWAAGGSHPGGKITTADDVLYSSHWLGRPLSADLTKKLVSLGIPCEKSGALIHLDGMVEWMHRIGAKGYEVEVYRTSTTNTGAFSTVSAYAGMNLVEESSETTVLMGDERKSLTLGGDKAVTRFKAVFDADQLTLTVPVRERGPQSARSCISAVRVIPKM